MIDNIRGAISTGDITNAARRRAILLALKRPESVVIIALTAMLLAVSQSALASGTLPRASAALWLVPGIFAEVAIVISTLRNEQLRRDLLRAVFYERVNSAMLATPELQRSVIGALEQHRMIFRAIVARPNAPLGEVAHAMDTWVTSVFDVAKRLDLFVNEPKVLENLQGRTLNASKGNDSSAAGMALLIQEDAPQEVADGDDNALVTVRKALIGARYELTESLDSMGDLYEEIMSSGPEALNNELAQGLHVMICDHLMRLERAGSLVQSLFQRYSRKQERYNEAPGNSIRSTKATIWRP